jgi:hypothetical protein
MGLIVIDTLHVNLIVLRMGSNELDPGDGCLVLHLNHQAVFIPSDVEHDPVIAADTGAAVLVFDVLRGLPACLLRFIVSTFQGILCVRATGLTPKLDQCTFGDHSHHLFSRIGRIVACCRLDSYKYSRHRSVL